MSNQSSYCFPGLGHHFQGQQQTINALFSQVQSLSSRINSLETQNKQLRTKVENLQSWKQETLNICSLFNANTCWKINANNYIGVLTTYFKDNKLQGDIRFEAHQNKVQILKEVCFNLRQNKISFTRNQQKFEADMDLIAGKLSGTFICSGKTYQFSGQLMK